jgi:hypothetical protein
MWEHSRNAARSSGDAFFLTSCNKRIAASMSDCVVETRDTFDSGRFLRFVVEFRRLRTKERSAEPDLECVREFDLETTVERRPRPSIAGSISTTSGSDQIAESASLLNGDSIESRISFRVLALRSPYRGESGKGISLLTTGLFGFEFVFVLGFDKRWCWAVDWPLLLLRRATRSLN